MVPLEWSLEGEGGQLVLGPDLDLFADFVPKVGDAADHVARFRAKRPVLKPGMEFPKDIVVHAFRSDAPSGAPVCKRCQTIRHPLVVGDCFH